MHDHSTPPVDPVRLASLPAWYDPGSLAFRQRAGRDCKWRTPTHMRLHSGTVATAAPPGKRMRTAQARATKNKQQTPSAPLMSPLDTLPKVPSVRRASRLVAHGELLEAPLLQAALQMTDVADAPPNLRDVTYRHYTAIYQCDS